MNMSFRRVSVYFLAALIGVGAAFMLLPRGVELPQDPMKPVAADPSGETKSVGSAGTDGKKEGKAESSAETSNGVNSPVAGGNPKANRIREALSTPEHAFLARTSPVWVQVRRVLSQHDESDWIERVNVLLDDISDGRRDVDFQGEVLFSRQNAMLESLWNSDFSAELTADLREPLAVLGERIEIYEN
jgi:hypothetical protein